MKKRIKKSLKTSNGITLIALVITIIVLLILAGISISMLSGDNSILQKATDAKNNTERTSVIEQARTDVLGYQAENRETNLQKSQLQSVLETYFKEVPDLTNMSDTEILNTELETLAKYGSYNITIKEIFDGNFTDKTEKWTYNHANQTVTNGELTLKIGDYIHNTSVTVDGFDGKWQVFGEENGKLLLITATGFAPFTGSSTTYGNSYPMLKLQATEGLNTCIKKINDIGALYEDGEKLENGRGATIEDINRLTGFDPSNVEVGIPFGDGTISQYTNKVTYTLKQDGKVWYKGTKAVTTETESEITEFKALGENNNITTPYEIESNGYYYYMYNLDLDDTGLSIFKTQGPSSWWLASSYVMADEGNVSWGLRTGGSYCSVSGCELWNSNGGNRSIEAGVRPVVSLKSNTILTFISTDSETGLSTYEI